MVVLIVMGVCGSGNTNQSLVHDPDWNSSTNPPGIGILKDEKKKKSTVAEALASKLKCCVKDADEFHSPENKDKMSKGCPLTDQDRLPWLCSIHHHIQGLADRMETGVVTCSALKKKYRCLLLFGEMPEDVCLPMPPVDSSVVFVYLRGTVEMIKRRLDKRVGHFMPASLLESQFNILEEPDASENCITVSVDNDIDRIVEEILHVLKKVYDKQI